MSLDDNLEGMLPSPNYEDESGLETDINKEDSFSDTHPKKKGFWKRLWDSAKDLFGGWYTLKTIAVGALVFSGLEAVESFYFQTDFITGNSTETHFVATSAAAVYAYFYHFKFYASNQLKKLGISLKQKKEGWDYNEITKTGASLCDYSLNISLTLSTLYFTFMTCLYSWDKDSNFYNYERFGESLALFPLLLPVAAIPMNFLIRYGVLFLDEKLSKSSKPLLKGNWNILLGKFDKAKEYFLEAYETNPNNATLLSLAELNLKMGDYDSSIEQFVKCLEDFKISEHEKILGISQAHFTEKYFLGKNFDPSKLVLAAISSLRYDSKEATISIFEEWLLDCYEKGSEEDIYFRILYARTLDEIVKNKKVRILDEVAKKEKDEREIKKEIEKLENLENLAWEQWEIIFPSIKSRFGEGRELGGGLRSKVWLIEPVTTKKGKRGTYIEQTYVIKESENEAWIKSEIDFRFNTLDSLVEKYKEIDTSREYSVVKQVGFKSLSDNAHYLIMVQENPTLTKKIKQKTATYDDYLALAKLMAYLHVHIPEKDTLGRLDPLEDVTQKMIMLNDFYAQLGELRGKSISLEEGCMNKILLNYKPVQEALEKQPYGCNRDGHPGNWSLPPGKVVILDPERGKMVPVVLDLVNLLEHTSYLSREEKLLIIEASASFYNEFAGNDIITDPAFFRLGYVDGIIHKSLSFFSVWSDPEWYGAWKGRLKVLDRSLLAIDPDHKAEDLNEINRMVGSVQDFSKHYRRFKTEYKNLKEGLIMLRETVKESDQFYSEVQQKMKKNLLSA